MIAQVVRASVRKSKMNDVARAQSTFKKYQLYCKKNYRQNSSIRTSKRSTHQGYHIFAILLSTWQYVACTVPHISIPVTDMANVVAK